MLSGWATWSERLTLTNSRIGSTPRYAATAETMVGPEREPHERRIERQLGLVQQRYKECLIARLHPGVHARRYHRRVRCRGDLVDFREAARWQYQKPLLLRDCKRAWW